MKVWVVMLSAALATAAPMISSITPSQLPTSGNVTVTIHGSGFGLAHDHPASCRLASATRFSESEASVQKVSQIAIWDAFLHPLLIILFLPVPKGSILMKYLK